MSPWPQQRSINSIRVLAQLAQDLGINLADSLAGTGLSPQQFHNMQGEVSAEQELRLVANFIHHYGGYSPTLGLSAGQRYHLSTYGIWGFALISSPTLRDAIHLGLRYFDLTFAFTRVRLEETHDHATLILDGSAIPPISRQFLVERDMSSIMTMVSELFNIQAPLRQVSFSHGGPVDSEPYRQIFGTVPQFRQPHNAITFARFFLDMAIPQGNPTTALICEHQCRELLSRRQQRSGVAAKVRDILIRQPQQLPDMEQVAERLFMSSRTLRRHLSAEGVSYRLLLDEVRMALAEELLKVNGITLEEISVRLGYSEVSNFLHAFKRCKGQTPSAFKSGMGH